jgi:CHASE3 domain sensor protein
MFAKMRIFQKLFIGIMLTFMGLMAIVTYFAYSRVSGSTRQDMAEAQFIRQKAVLEPKVPQS